ncbi:MAG: sulfite exporter TauE/SafE family protein [Pirellulaceae bacterium]
MLFPLSILFGAFVGFALGLTGGGGSLLAVPLLVYGLAIAPREAFGVSLAAVGATALVGVLPRIRAGQVEVGTGILFAIAGMLGAPLGTWVAGMIPETVLLTMFAVLMFVVAWQLWNKSKTKDDDVQAVCNTNKRGPTCQRTADSKLRLTSRCAMSLAAVGLMTGFLSGMFGVGGGFVIVPALVMFSGMPIHKAVATSLFVIMLVSISGVASHFAAGRGISLEVTGLFVLGGVIGMSLGGLISKRLPAPVLQNVFASGIVAVAIFIVSKTFV